MKVPKQILFCNPAFTAQDEFWHMEEGTWHIKAVQNDA